jgi:hypothetical protein
MGATKGVLLLRGKGQVCCHSGARTHDITRANRIQAADHRYYSGPAKYPTAHLIKAFVEMVDFTAAMNIVQFFSTLTVRCVAYLGLIGAQALEDTLLAFSILHTKS